MATIEAGPDVITFTPVSFAKGSESVTVNGVQAYEGKLNRSDRAEFNVDGRNFDVLKHGRGYRIRVSKDGAVQYEGAYLPVPHPLEQYIPKLMRYGGRVSVVIGLLGFCIASYIYWQAARSLSWPTTSAKVSKALLNETTTRIKYRGVQPFFTPDIAFAYSVDGKNFISNRISVSPPAGSTSKTWAQNYLDRYHKGRVVDIYYNPEDPGYAVLEPGSTRTHNYFFMISAVFVIVGTFALVIGPLAIRHMAKESEEFAALSGPPKS